MAKQGHGGSIIGVSSISALVGGGRQVHYTPTKAGVLSLMQSCAVALGKYKIRCNALLPGTIQTQLNEADLKDEEKRKYMETRIPLGRVGKPEDMAGPAVFLASDLAGYVVSESVENHEQELIHPCRQEHSYSLTADYLSIFNNHRQSISTFLIRAL
jgi:NAD(P)-dependent dehydrogenase (short-subunit alcohol dehydrogenase family)